MGISQLILTAGDWHLSDTDAYWDAAQRLRNGGELYPPVPDPERSDVYRYAPWFAWAWVPATFLPQGVVYAIWSLILLAASAAALVPLVRCRAWLAVAFFLPILVGISGIGNVQPLIVAALVLGVERRSGPLWIGLTASLKAFPILLAVTYLGRRQWRRAAAAVGVALVLTAPMLAYDLANYPLGAASAAMLAAWPVIYAIVVAVAILAAARLADGTHAWLASSTAVSLALPRFFVYDVSFLMVSIPNRRGTASPDDRAIPSTGDSS